MADLKEHQNVLSIAAKSLTYNIILQILMRIVSFLSNALIIRLISRNVLGVINVRLMLLYSTTLCLSREAFRRSCLCKMNDKNCRKVINILWLPVPVCFFTGLLLWFIWLRMLSPPDPQFVPFYGAGVTFVFVSVMVEVFAEPLFVFSQSFGFVKLKVILEGISLTAKSLAMVILLMQWPQLGIYAFCYSQVICSLVYTCGYYIFFWWYFKVHTSSSMPLKSVAEAFPLLSSKNSFVDKDLLLLTWSFYKQTILKQFLTEGERYIMTVFNVLSFSEQGIYDIVSNLGSLAARLIFLPIEESGYLLFSHLVKRGQQASEQDNSEMSFTVLLHLLKLMSLLGLTIVVFGFSYSKLLLFIYGGEDLSNSIALPLMRCHCLYILFLALNGVSECFVFAAMSSADIDRYNRKMICFSIAFLIVAIYFTSVFGSVGFLIANCLNFTLRIIHSFYFICWYYSKTTIHLLKTFLPHSTVLVMFAGAFAVTYLSEVYLGGSRDYQYLVVHVAVGWTCLIAVLGTVYHYDKELVLFVKRQVLGREKSKKTD